MNWYSKASGNIRDTQGTVGGSTRVSTDRHLIKLRRSPISLEPRALVAWSFSKGTSLRDLWAFVEMILCIIPTKQSRWHFKSLIEVFLSYYTCYLFHSDYILELKVNITMVYPVSRQNVGWERDLKRRAIRCLKQASWKHAMTLWECGLLVLDTIPRGTSRYLTGNVLTPRMS